MARSPPVSGSPPAPEPREASRSPSAPRLWDDGVLRLAFLAVGLLLAYQLAVTLLQPAWLGPATDWLLVLIAWPGLLGTVLLSRWFTRTGQPGALSWWLVSGGLLSHTLARTIWLGEDQVLFSRRVPEPSLDDFFYALEYVCFLLALLLLPRVRPRIRRARVTLDVALLLGSAVALSWYFLLAPLYLSRRTTVLAKLPHLSFPLGSLTVLFGLIVVLLRYREYVVDRAVLLLLLAGNLCLVVADFWGAAILLNTSSYPAGSPSDLFWLAFYLLVVLSALVQFRLAQHARASGSVRQQPSPLRRQDFLAVIQHTLPMAGVVLATVVLLFRAELGLKNLLPAPVPLLIVLCLLVLALVRQALTVADNERLRRDQEASLQEATAEMETFLGIAGHELKNPLASMKLCQQLAERRIQQLIRREPDIASTLEPVREPVEQAERQEERLDRLVNDLLDVSRVRAGKLELHLEPTDLVGLVREAVEEQRQIHPERTLQLACPEAGQVPVRVDPFRLGQVVTNYLTNALKYSAADRAVAVDLAVEGQEARVAVRDEGPGIPAREQERIWERYHRVKGIEVQSGTGVGLGLGLPICRAIIEQHQGQVGVQSTPGHGSAFWFSLPIAPPEPALQGCTEDTPEGWPGEGEQPS